MNRLAKIVVATAILPGTEMATQHGGWTVVRIPRTDVHDPELDVRWKSLDGYIPWKIFPRDVLVEQDLYVLFGPGDASGFLMFFSGRKMSVLKMDCGHNQFPLYDLNMESSVERAEEDFPGALDALIMARPVGNEVDWRPDETIPEDFYAS